MDAKLQCSFRALSGGGGKTLKMKLHLLLQPVLVTLLENVHQILVAWHVNLLSAIVYHTLTSTIRSTGGELHQLFQLLDQTLT